jgi:hypothetical protein
VGGVACDDGDGGVACCPAAMARPKKSKTGKTRTAPLVFLRIARLLMVKMSFCQARLLLHVDRQNPHCFLARKIHFCA